MITHASHSNGMYRRHHPLYHSRAPFAPTPYQSRMPHPYYNARSQQTHMYYSPTPVSPTNSADEVEAAAALISLPSSTNGSPALRPVESPMIPNSINATKPIYHPTLPTLTPDAIDSYNDIPIRTIVNPPTCHHVVPPSTDTSSVSSTDSIPLHCMPTNSHDWYTGSTSLSLPQDDNVLSPLHCFLRKYCVEAFSATSEDVATPRYGKSHGGKIVTHQVGIRCLFCKSLPNKPERAVCYPSSLRNIYHSIETWQRRHAPVCNAIPPWIKRELTHLIETSRTTAGGRRQYWQDAAEQLGMIDTPQGVRFARPPGIMGNTTFDDMAPQDTSPSTPLVTNQDGSMVTDFLFVLMQQMETCEFQEEDRTGGRSKVKDYPVGFGGMQCRHCRGMAGFGRYFPSSINALALANSDRNVYNHLKKCRKCPESTKEELRRLHDEDGAKNKRGSRKEFFTKIWGRIHDNNA